MFRYFPFLLASSEKVIISSVSLFFLISFCCSTEGILHKLVEGWFIRQGRPNYSLAEILDFLKGPLFVLQDEVFSN